MNASLDWAGLPQNRKYSDAGGGGQPFEGDSGEGVRNCSVGALLGAFGYSTGAGLAWLTGLMLRILAGSG